MNQSELNSHVVLLVASSYSSSDFQLSMLYADLSEALMLGGLVYVPCDVFHCVNPSVELLIAHAKEQYALHMLRGTVSKRYRRSFEHMKANYQEWVDRGKPRIGKVELI